MPSPYDHVLSAIRQHASHLHTQARLDAERLGTIRDLRQAMLDLGFLVQESDPLFRASPAAALTASDLTLLRSVPQALAEIAKMEGPEGKQGPALQGEKGEPGDAAVFDPDAVRPIVEELLATREQEEPFDPVTLLPLIDKAIADHEAKEPQENPFLLGTKEVDEATLVDGGVLTFDRKRDRLVYEKSKGKGKLSGGASYASLRNLPYTIQTVTADTTLAVTDGVVLVNAASPVTITPPSAVNISGRAYYVKNINTGTVTIAPPAGQTIDGAATFAIATQYESITFISNGVSFFVI